MDIILMKLHYKELNDSTRIQWIGLTHSGIGLSKRLFKKWEIDEELLYEESLLF